MTGTNTSLPWAGDLFKCVAAQATIRIHQTDTTNASYKMVSSATVSHLLDSRQWLFQIPSKIHWKVPILENEYRALVHGI